jgi:hypothetical protein
MDGSLKLLRWDFCRECCRDLSIMVGGLLCSWGCRARMSRRSYVLSSNYMGPRRDTVLTLPQNRLRKLLLLELGL